MPVRFDPLLNKVRIKDVIPQVTSDPASPKAQDAWVLANEPEGEIQAFLGLGFPYIASGSLATYQLSYRTKQGTTVRVSLT